MRKTAAYFLVALGLVLTSLPLSNVAHADSVETGQPAPLFTLPNQEGKPFSLASRKGAGWTVLYFYPKAETPGCTKQACAFRDAIKVIRALGTEVYGISADTVESQAGFHANHQLQFDLLADPEGKVIEKYGATMPIIGYAKRWTFILDPELNIRGINRDVDPALDAQHVADTIKVLQAAR